MDNYLYEAFLEHLDVIKELARKDHDFHTTCADYEEICIWLEKHGDASSSTEAKERLHAQEIKRDLEEEIIYYIGEHHAST